MNIPQFIYSAVDGFWNCFLFGATTNEADVDIDVQVFVWTGALISLGKMPM